MWVEADLEDRHDWLAAQQRGRSRSGIQRRC
jgi:hypothetical protein